MLKQLLKVFLVMLSLMLVITLVLTIFEKFNIDTANDNDLFGIYNSSLTGYGAFYNPLIEVIWFTQLLALLVMPFVLAMLKNKLKVLIAPWIIISIIMLFELLVWPFYYPVALNLDIQSILPKFGAFELRTILTIIVGLTAYYSFKKSTKF